MTIESPERLWLLAGVAALAIAYVILQRRRSRYALSMEWPASCRRMRMHHAGVPPSTSSICSRSSRARRGWAR